MLPLDPSIRMVAKGAYREAEDIAFPKKGDVDRNFVRLTRSVLLECHRSNGAEGTPRVVATHDAQMIGETNRLALRARAGQGERYEFALPVRDRDQAEQGSVWRGRGTRCAC